MMVLTTAGREVTQKLVWPWLGRATGGKIKQQGFPRPAGEARGPLERKRGRLGC